MMKMSDNHNDDDDKALKHNNKLLGSFHCLNVQ